MKLSVRDLIRLRGVIHKRPVIIAKVNKVCPYCYSNKFEKSKRQGFHPIGRWYCHNCKGFFFKPIEHRYVKKI